jgi:hypothetical protein
MLELELRQSGNPRPHIRDFNLDQWLELRTSGIDGSSVACWPRADHHQILNHSSTSQEPLSATEQVVPPSQNQR